MKNLVAKVLALRAYLQGKKTYLVAVFAGAQGLWQYFVQHGVSLHTVVTYLTVAGGLASLRAGLTNALAVLPKKR